MMVTGSNFSRNECLHLISQAKGGLPCGGACGDVICPENGRELFHPARLEGQDMLVVREHNPTLDSDM